MAVTAKFIADFSSFQSAVDKARLDLKSFETQSASVEKQLSRVADAFSGRRILSEATLATEAVERIGGASKLTSAEQARVNAMVAEAIEKYRALGQQAPADMLALERATRRVKDAQQDFGATAVNTSEFFNQRTKQSADTLGLVGTAARSLGPAIAGAFTAGKVIDFIRDAGEAGDRLQTFRERAGISAAALQEFDVIAEKSRTTLEAMVKNAEQLGIRLTNGETGAVKAVKDLGLNVDALLAMRPEDRFTAVMAALGGVGDETRRAVLGTALMGKGFTEVAAAADASFAQMRDQARESVRTLTDAQVQALASANDAWEHFQGRVARGGQIIAAEIVRGLTLPKRWFDDAVGATEVEATLGRLRTLAAEAANEVQKLGKATAPPPDGVAGYNELTTAVAAAYREFRNLSDSDEQRIRNSVLLGKAVKELAEEYRVSERAIQFVIDAGKLEADQKEIQRKKTEELRAEEERLADTRRKQVESARDELFGNDAIKRAELYVAALGDVTRVSGLSADAQAKLAEVMRAGVEALVLQGRATSEQTSLFEAFRLKATETARDAAAAYQLMQSQAALAAEADREMARAMEENRRAIEAMTSAGTKLAATQGPEVDGLAGKWRGLGTAVRGVFSIPVPRNFSWEQAFRDAGFVTHNSISGLRPMATGGVVTRPTAALIGERGPEAVVPLNQWGGAGLGTTVHVTIQGPMFLRDRNAMRELAAVLNEETMRQLSARRKFDTA